MMLGTFGSNVWGVGVCPHCGEPFRAGDSLIVSDHSPPLHEECAIRLKVGPVGHQEARCPCFGGSYIDPPGLTRRQAAQAAAALFKANRERPRRN